MDYRKLGVRVRQQREMNDLTQGELASKVNVSTSFIGHIERGEKTVVALCNALEVSPMVLLQDSLSDAVIESQLNFNEESQDLMKDIMHVLREHTNRREYK